MAAFTKGDQSCCDGLQSHCWDGQRGPFCLLLTCSRASPYTLKLAAFRYFTERDKDSPMPCTGCLFIILAKGATFVTPHRVLTRYVAPEWVDHCSSEAVNVVVNHIVLL